MFTYKDQIGRGVNIITIPRRIISLVPSQTELLFDLGLNEEIIGITKFCVHPKDKVGGVKKIGGTKKFNFDAIHALEPDVIIGNKEENYKEGIDRLYEQYPVWVSNITNLNEAFQMMKMIGNIVGKKPKAEQIVENITIGLGALNPKIKKEALYLIWKKPYMSIGGDTFISHMMQYAGFTNILRDSSRYPVVKATEIEALQPEFILLSSEPYPFKDKHIGEFSKISPRSKVLIVDGEMFSWYGSRLQYAADYFKNLTTN